MSSPDILHIEACNFIDAPVGGQLSFSRQLMTVFGNRLALAGWAKQGEPVGEWFEKNIEGTRYKYFAFGREIPARAKPLIPSRLTTLIQILRHRRKMLSLEIRNLIVSEHAVMMGLRRMHDYNVCYNFPGTESPLSISRYPLALLLSNAFDRFFFWSLARNVRCILAAADAEAIAKLKMKSYGYLHDRQIMLFPTRVDTSLFFPDCTQSTRKQLGISSDVTLVVTSGRIHWAKGWRLLLEAFELFLESIENAVLVFVGDGPDRKQLEELAASKQLVSRIVVTGYLPSLEVARYLQAADLFVMGSVKEGWSTALLEALACGLPAVTTRFSSADSIVKDGINGYLVEREPKLFADAMVEALRLQGVEAFAKQEIERYALRNMRRDLLEVWPLLSEK